MASWHFDNNKQKLVKCNTVDPNGICRIHGNSDIQADTADEAQRKFNVMKIDEATSQDISEFPPEYAVEVWKSHVDSIDNGDDDEMGVKTIESIANRDGVMEKLCVDDDSKYIAALIDVLPVDKAIDAWQNYGIGYESATSALAHKKGVWDSLDNDDKLEVFEYNLDAMSPSMMVDYCMIDGADHYDAYSTIHTDSDYCDVVIDEIFRREKTGKYSYREINSFIDHAVCDDNDEVDGLPGSILFRKNWIPAEYLTSGMPEKWTENYEVSSLNYDYCYDDNNNEYIYADTSDSYITDVLKSYVLDGEESFDENDDQYSRLNEICDSEEYGIYVDKQAWRDALHTHYVTYHRSMW